MAQIVFVAVALLGGVWFLVRRRVDPMFAGFGSALIYFIPGFFGWVSYPSGAASQIHDGTYLVMSIVLAAIILLSIGRRKTAGAAITAPFDQYIPSTLFGIVLVGGGGALFTTGAFFFCEKHVMLANIDGWYYLAAYALPLCMVSAIACRQYALAGASLVVLFADFYIGFRGSAAMVIIATALLFGQSLFAGKRQAANYLGLLVVGGAILFMSPQIAYTLKYVASGACPATATEIAHAAAATAMEQVAHLAQHMTTTEPYIQAVLQSEPFVIQSVLNRVIEQGFQTDAAYLMDQILTGVPGAISIFNLHPSPPTFNSLFQPVLFPDVPYGMANSPWAQAYAAGGYVLVAVFAFAFAGLLLGLSALFDRTSGAVRGLLTVISAWLAFYFHRNDLLAETGILKQVLYTSTAACFAAAVVWLSLRFLRRKRLEHAPA